MKSILVQGISCSAIKHFLTVQIYLFILQLINTFIMCLVRSSKCILLKLSNSTVGIIRYHAMIMLLMINKGVEQWGYRNHSTRKQFMKSRFLLNIFSSHNENYLTTQSLWEVFLSLRSLRSCFGGRQKDRFTTVRPMRCV